MAIECRILRNEYGEIDHVIANNGERSELFDNLVDISGGNKNTALNLYALTETEEFKELVELKSNEEKVKFLKEFEKKQVDSGAYKKVGSLLKEGLDFGNFKDNKIISGINEELVKLSEEYKKEEGLKNEFPRLILSVSEKDAMAIADAYDQMKHSPEDPQVKRAYAELTDQAGKQARLLIRNGYRFELAKPGQGYNSDSSKMVADVKNNKHIFIDPSSESFGTTREFDKENIGLADSGFKDINGISLTNVEVIRAVHDVFGHAKYGTQFGAIGEENAWRVHMSMFTPLAQKALTATTRGQNSWVNFGPHMRSKGELLKKGDPGFVPVNERPFAEQKIGFLSDWAMDNAYGDMVTINGNQIKPVNKYIFSGEEIYEIADGKAYHDAALAAKNSRLSEDIPVEKRDGIQVFVDTAENYQDMINKGGKLLVSKDGLVGVKIESDGNIGSGFSHLDNTKQNALAPFLIAGIKMGARYTNAYETYLPKYYARFGFVPTARLEFDPALAEKGWEDSILKDKPDVIFMKYAGGDRATIETRVNTFPKYENTGVNYVANYEDGEALSKEESIKEESTATLIPTTKVSKVGETTEEQKPTVTYKESKVFSKERINPFTGKSTGEIELQLIETDKLARSKGQARVALKEFLKYTDAIGKDVYLTVTPRDKSTRFTSLVDFYKSEGFEMEPTEFEMIRKAKSVKAANFDVNGEPDIKTVLDFSNRSSDGLTSEEKVQAMNFLVSTGLKTSTELLSKLEDTFFKNGLFVANKVKMSKSGLYNKFEISEITQSPILQKEIKELVLALRNTEEMSIDYDSKFVKGETTSLNNFGKQTVSNPYILEKEIATEIAGVPLEDIRQYLSSDMSSKYKTDAAFKKVVDRIATENKLASVKKIVNGELVDKTSDTSEKLNLTLIKEIDQELLEKLYYLTNSISENVWNQNLDLVSKSIEDVSILAKQNGIDFSNLSTKIYSIPRQEVVNLLNSFVELVASEDSQNLEEFSSLYDNMFDITQPQKELIKTDSEFDVVLDTNLSEQELFSSYDLVKKADGIYRKIDPTTLDDLYDSFFNYKNLFPNSITDIEQLKSYVQEKSIDNVENGFSIEEGDMEKMWMYKKFFNFPMNISKERVEVERTKNITLDSEYLTGDFIKDFNVYLLESGNKYFKVTEKGIELENNDPISKEEAKLSLSEELTEVLAQYDALSRHLNLGLESKLDTYEDFNTENAQRVNAVNNPDSVPKLTGEYTYVEEGILAAKNEANAFVRTPVGVFELVYEVNNVKFFNKLPDADPNYKLYELEKPLTNVDFNNYFYLQNSVEVFKEAKKNYNKKELEKINKDYFDC